MTYKSKKVYITPRRILGQPTATDLRNPIGKHLSYCQLKNNNTLRYHDRFNSSSCLIQSSIYTRPWLPRARAEYVSIGFILWRVGERRACTYWFPDIKNDVVSDSLAIHGEVIFLPIISTRVLLGRHHGDSQADGPS